LSGDQIFGKLQLAKTRNWIFVVYVMYNQSCTMLIRSIYITAYFQ